MYLEQKIVSGTRFLPSLRVPPSLARGELHQEVATLRVAKISGGGRDGLCLVRSISAGGLLAHVHDRFPLHERVQILFRDDLPLYGRIVWAQEQTVGLAFDAPVDVQDVLAKDKLGSGRRTRAPRVEISRCVTLYTDGVAHRAALIDISQGGAKIGSFAALTVNADVLLSIEKLASRTGTVKWIQDRSAGIAFDRPIGFAELARWLGLTI